jgi:hypothetical protein
MQSAISKLLKQRGHEVTREGNESDILLPASASSEVIAPLKEVLYNLMRRDRIRKALRDWAFGQSSDSNSAQCIEAYIKLCAQFGDWGDNSHEIRQVRYAKTFEWYISELFHREFAARASGFGFRLKDANPDDEFDCIAVLDEGTVFVECKTGRDSIYSDVVKFIRRDAELAANYSFYVVDRDYIFQKEGDDVADLSRERAMELRILAIHQISVKGHQFFDIASAGIYGRYFLACSAFDGLEDRIRYMIRYCDEGNLEPHKRSRLFDRQEIFCYGIDPRGL